MRALSLGILILLAAPALAGCIATDDPVGDTAGTVEDLTQQAVPELDGKALVAHVQSFVEAHPKRNANGPNHQAARDYLEAQFADAGLDVVRQGFEAPVSATSTPTNIATADGHLENVIGIKWGRSTTDWIVIGGHYDVTDGAVYGAYDDGSGTILTVELAKAFATMETEKTIAFTMFDGEEQGLRGSTNFMETILDGTFPETLAGDEDVLANISSVPEIFAMMNLDMFGINWPAEAPIYFDENSDAIRGFVDETRQGIGIPDEKFQFRGITLGRSDYAPFEDADIPVAFFISSFEENCPMGQCLPEGVQNPFWHRADTVESMELMAGSRELLEAGFTTAGTLSSSLLHFLATTPDMELDVQER